MISDSLKEYVKKQDLKAIRSVFFIILSTRPTSEIINENLSYCLENGIDENLLFMEHDGEIFLEDVKYWNIDYYSRLVGKIENNFSKERIGYIMKMSDYLFSKNSQTKAENNVHYRQSNTVLYIVVGVIATLIIFFIIKENI
ncbi:hypothetical protein [Campylobacter concisus]